MSENIQMASRFFQAMGGAAGCRNLSEAFYTRVARDPTLRPLFPGKTMTCAIEAFAAFLVQFLGGSADDAARRWWLSLRESHLRFRIGPEERDAWLSCMAEALNDVEAGIPEPVRSPLLCMFEHSSAYVVNVGESPAPRGNMHPEMAQRWDAQRRLDEAVAAVRHGDAHRAKELAQNFGGSVLAGLLALMIETGESAMLAYVCDRIRRDPELVREPYAGRTLLHAAAAAGCLSVVELLLSMGADPNVADGGGHTPLYSVGNECRVAGGSAVVRALVRAGASVDAQDGAKHCTALHMAARRGNVEVAKALLDCGADIEARDSLGETPLRRAVNLDKTGVAELLVSRGADVNAKGSKKLTPLTASRSGTMQKILQSLPKFG